MLVYSVEDGGTYDGVYLRKVTSSLEEAKALVDTIKKREDEFLDEMCPGMVWEETDDVWRRGSSVVKIRTWECE